VTTTERLDDRERSAYVGWVAAGLVLLAVFAACTVVWFIFHPW
jgi:hypothetical protein